MSPFTREWGGPSGVTLCQQQLGAQPPQNYWDKHCFMLEPACTSSQKHPPQGLLYISRTARSMAKMFQFSAEKSLQEPQTERQHLQHNIRPRDWVCFLVLRQLKQAQFTFSKSLWGYLNILWVLDSHKKLLFFPTQDSSLKMVHLRNSILW